MAFVLNSDLVGYRSLIDFLVSRGYSESGAVEKVTDPFTLALYSRDLFNLLEEKELRRALVRIHLHNKHLPLMSALTADQITLCPDFLMDIYSRWLGLEGCLESPNIIPLTDLDRYYGRCPDLENSHEWTFLQPQNQYYGDFVILRVDGKVFGVMEMAIQYSVCGLANVTCTRANHPSYGTHPVVLGGIYGVPREIGDLADNKTLGGRKKFQILDLPNLPLYPLRAVGHNSRGTFEMCDGFNDFENHVGRLIEARDRFTMQFLNH